MDRRDEKKPAPGTHAARASIRRGHHIHHTLPFAPLSMATQALPCKHTYESTAAYG